MTLNLERYRQSWTEVMGRYPKKETELTEAIIKGNREELIRLLSEGHDPRQRNDLKFTPLLVAAALDDDKGIDYIEPLLRFKADIDERTKCGLTALSLACQCKNWKTAKLLLQLGADIHCGDNPLLHLAAIEGQEELVHLLLKAGLSIDWPFRGETPLFVAVRRSRLSKVRLFVENGSSPDQKNFNKETPLLLSCTNRNLAIFNALLPYSKQSINAHVDYLGNTLLHRALFPVCIDEGHGKRSRVIERLLEVGASTNIANNIGALPMHYAIERATASSAKTIIDATSKDVIMKHIINPRMSEGKNLMGMAAERNDPLIFEAIKSKGFPKAILEAPIQLTNPEIHDPQLVYTKQAKRLLYGPIAWAALIKGHLPLSYSSIQPLMDFGISLDPQYKEFEGTEPIGCVSGAITCHKKHRRDVACYCLNTIKFLLENGGDPDFSQKKRMPRSYILAAEKNMTDVLGLLLRYSWKMDIDPLIEGLSILFRLDQNELGRSPWARFLCGYAVGKYRQQLPGASGTVPSLRELCRSSIRKSARERSSSFQTFKALLHDHLPKPIANYLLYHDLLD